MSRPLVRVISTSYPSRTEEAGCVEITPNITAELNNRGELIGIEILEASTFIRDSVLESVQARVLDLAKAKTA